jgi:hypothetical protein
MAKLSITSAINEFIRRMVGKPIIKDKAPLRPRNNHTIGCARSDRPTPAYGYQGVLYLISANTLTWPFFIRRGLSL